MTRTIQRPEPTGFVRRSPTDERATIIEATPAGHTNGTSRPPVYEPTFIRWKHFNATNSASR